MGEWFIPVVLKTTDRDERSVSSNLATSAMYEEHEFVYTEWCIYRRDLINQGIWWCENGHSPCDENCPFRTPKEHRCIIATASTEDYGIRESNISRKGKKKRVPRK